MVKPISHGGRRPGAGRKPNPDKLVNVQAKVPPELKARLELEAQAKGLTLSKFIAKILAQQFIN